MERYRQSEMGEIPVEKRQDRGNDLLRNQTRAAYEKMTREKLNQLRQQTRDSLTNYPSQFRTESRSNVAESKSNTQKTDKNMEEILETIEQLKSTVENMKQSMADLPEELEHSYVERTDSIMSKLQELGDDLTASHDQVQTQLDFLKEDVAEIISQEATVFSEEASQIKEVIDTQMKTQTKQWRTMKRKIGFVTFLSIANIVLVVGILLQILGVIQISL